MPVPCKLDASFYVLLRIYLNNKIMSCLYCRSKNLLHIYTTPPPAYEVRSEPEALYLYLLFALLDPHTGMIEANFASIIYNAMSVLESRLPDLIEDIEKGRLNPSLEIDPAVRKVLDASLKPNPERASEIRNAMQGGNEGLVKRLWPELHILLGADTGTFALYGEKLRNGYCKGIYIIISLLRKGG